MRHGFTLWCHTPADQLPDSPEEKLRDAHHSLGHVLGHLSYFRVALSEATIRRWTPWVGGLCVSAGLAGGVLIDPHSYSPTGPALASLVVFAVCLLLMRRQGLCSWSVEVGSAVVESLTRGEALLASEVICSSSDVYAPARSRHQGRVWLRKAELLITAVVRLHRERGYDVTDELRELLAGDGQDADRIVEHAMAVVASRQAR